jgi:hypothetical protein
VWTFLAEEINAGVDGAGSSGTCTSLLVWTGVVLYRETCTVVRIYDTDTMILLAVK